MINYKNVKQKSIEWHELRWGRIGGTLSSGLFTDSETLLIDLISQRTEQVVIDDDCFISKDMERGNELEPLARNFLEKYHGIKFLETGWLQCEENELLGISPDGISECETMACEIKCFGRKQHMTTLLEQEIPKKHVHQIIHYFTVNPKLEKLFFIAFRPEAPKHFQTTITKDSIIDIGTKAKPKYYTIKELVGIAKREANILLEKIKEIEKSLNEF
jgi:predicted phage-related endonuclease